MIALVILFLLIFTNWMDDGLQEPRGQAGLQALAGAKIVCDGANDFTWIWLQKPADFEKCFTLHEEDHIDWLKSYKPSACEEKCRGCNPAINEQEKAETECRAYRASLECLRTQLLKKPTLTASIRPFLLTNIRRHEEQIARYCP